MVCRGVRWARGLEGHRLEGLGQRPDLACGDGHGRKGVETTWEHLFEPGARHRKSGSPAFAAATF